MSRTAKGDNGTRFDCLFLDRPAGIVQTGATSLRSSSEMAMPATSPIRCPVASASFSVSAVARVSGRSPATVARSPRAMPLVARFLTGARSSASHSWRISSGDNSRSRGVSVLIGGGMPHVGST